MLVVALSSLVGIAVAETVAVANLWTGVAAIFACGGAAVAAGLSIKIWFSKKDIT
jgi:hypothetical protein